VYAEDRGQRRRAIPRRRHLHRNRKSDSSVAPWVGAAIYELNIYKKLIQYATPFETQPTSSLHNSPVHLLHLVILLSLRQSR